MPTVNFRSGDDGAIRAKQQLCFDDKLNFLVRHCFTCEVRKSLLDLSSPCQEAKQENIDGVNTVGHVIHVSLSLPPHSHRHPTAYHVLQDSD